MRRELGAIMGPLRAEWGRLESRICYLLLLASCLMYADGHGGFVGSLEAEGGMIFAR